MKDKGGDGPLRESKGREGGECRRRGREGGCTRGDGRRICETSLRKYAQLNFSTPMASPAPLLCPASVPFVSHPRFPCLPACLPLPRPSYVGPHLLRRPRILRPACCLCPSSRFDPSFFFPSQRTFSVSPLSPLHGARSISFILRHHPRLRLQHARSFVTAPLFSRCPTLFATPRRSIIPQSRGV